MIKNNRFSYLFIIIPTIFLLIGFLLFPDVIGEGSFEKQIISIPLFAGLILLFLGFFSKDNDLSKKIKILGWIIFAFYWSALPKTLYFGEDGDFVNAFICIAGVYLLSYFAYHEWLSIRRDENISCLNWLAGASSIAGIIYFGVELTPLASWLIETVAFQSAFLLNLFVGNTYVEGVNIFSNGVYAVTIIFACTAVQSMVIFVGMIFSLKNIKIKKIVYGLLLTIVPIYFLNLIRNGFIAYLMANDITDFSTAHNIIGKGGSLLALVILLIIVSKIIPEIFDEIICLTDLPKRKGPIEKIFKVK